MDLDAWQVDLKRSLATHSSGFKLSVQGDPRRPSGVLPGEFPVGLSAVEQAALLRGGLAAIMRQAGGDMTGGRRAELAERSVGAYCELP